MALMCVSFTDLNTRNVSALVTLHEQLQSLRAKWELLQNPALQDLLCNTSLHNHSLQSDVREILRLKSTRIKSVSYFSDHNRMERRPSERLHELLERGRGLVEAQRHGRG
jgi:hypothetical protein